MSVLTNIQLKMSRTIRMKLNSQPDEKIPVPIESSEKSLNFSILKNINGSVLLTDNELGICILKWQGRVDIETASELLTLGVAAAKLDGHSKLLIDRRGLIEFDGEARKWIDQWIRKKARVISPKDGKVAIINSEGTLAHIFNNVFNSTISMVFPHLKLRKFDNGTKAIEWLAT